MMDPPPKINGHLNLPRSTSSNSLDPFQSLDGIEDIINDLETNPNVADDLPPIDDSASPGTTWRLNNTAPSVHMEVQENAKLPTLNMTIDRKGSSLPGVGGGESADVDKSLAELFLTTPARASVNANYQSGRNASNSSIADAEMEALLKQVNPTPLSEISERHERHVRKLHQASHNQPFGSLPITKISPVLQDKSTLDMAGAAQDLTVPKLEHASTLKTPPALVDSEGMAQAVATAAAIAQRSKPPSPPSFGTTHRSAPVSHSQAHAVPKAALASASSQQRQYGFGKTHVVPSVPAPPPISGKTGSAPSQSSAVDMRKRKSAPINGTGTEAYERKKQRAKDARVKLNDAIEELSIAIQLAGTQSEQRVNAMRATDSNPTSHLLHQLKQGVSISKAAKKWDRPSFVGSAAALIHNLNAQAQGLQQQLVVLRQQLRKAKAVDAVAPSATSPSSRISPAAPAIVASVDKVPAPESSRPPKNLPVKVKEKHVVSLADANPKSHEGSSQPVIDPTARVANEETSSSLSSLTSNSSEVSSSSSLPSEGKALGCIASFLDARSLGDCQQTCRLWRKAFADESNWNRLLIDRFGFFNVRQWRARTEHEKDESKDTIVAPSHKLYALMDVANVMPQLTQEGISMLGESRLPGKISAWAFIVLRSNGETLRSVLKPDCGDRTYCSLPIVQLRIIVQNTGVSTGAISINQQKFNVDSSTRRRGEEMKEVDWDDRFKKSLLSLDGQPFVTKSKESAGQQPGCEELCRLRLFETVVIELYIHAKSCSTTSKFLQRTNFTKILVGLGNGVTIPVVIPFPRDASHLLH